MTIKDKIKRYRQCFINDLIYRNYYQKEIDESLVYVESRDGNDFTGNILRIVEELSKKEYGDLKIAVYAKENVHKKIAQLKKNYNLKIDKIITKEHSATETAETAKYIVTDSGMRPKFVKRPGQILLETWHGTPLKTMGIDNEAEEHRCANIQQVFFAADYLLYPNEYMKDKMLSAYMMNKIYPGKILFEGYPRNSVFFKDSNLKEKLDFNGKEVFAYMPTFKGEFLNRKDEKQRNDVYNYLTEIDGKLNDNQILLVKLHVYNQKQIDFTSFKHIRPFPEGYEIYDILNICDALITDYSSVMFDFANTKRKIILFNYDEAEYMSDRGTYFPIENLPFSKVQTADDLVRELNSPKNYDDSEFLDKFCTYDNPDATERLCRHVFKNEKISKEDRIKNNNKNILIFSGGLKNNGMTSSLKNILSKIDLDKYNIFICYSSWDPNMVENHREIFNSMPDGIQYCPLRMSLNLQVKEQREFVNFLKNPDRKVSKTLTEMFSRELKRAFNDFPFDSIIHFNGYGIEETMLFSVSSAEKSIWVHNDMTQELSSGKNNQNLSVLKHVYKSYDNVVVVSPDLIEPTAKISGTKDNIRLVHNVNTIDEIKAKSEMDIEINASCTVNCPNPDGIEGVLAEKTKFITIGRFSPEKAHDRLINAFNRYCKDNPDTQLIIIGGYGESYEKTLNQARNSEFSHNISIIKSILNPMPILKQCDLFVVSSYYEGWPMVIMEADAFDIPVIATDITGTQWMRQYGGHITENSEEGILQGMYDFKEGKVSALGIDYEEYNENAVSEFLNLIE